MNVEMFRCLAIGFVLGAWFGFAVFAVLQMGKDDE